MKSILLRIHRSVVRSRRRLRARTAARTLSKVELSKCLKEPKDIQTFLSDFRSRAVPLFFFDESDIDFFRKASFPEKQTIIKDADSVCNHDFDLLGSGKTNVDGEGGKIDWHKDFKSGVRWDPSVFYTDIPSIKGDGRDIIVPWELSRVQHLPTLGKAYQLTGDEKYAKEFVDEVIDWIDSNLPGYGVNWRCTMDVAIRVVNWIWGYNFFRDSPHISDGFLLKFLKSLHIHERHIMANLERRSRVREFGTSLLIHRRPIMASLHRSWTRITNNHYLSNIVGLVYLGIMLPEFKKARKWLGFGMKELIREMGKQVYPDGVVYEGSISYHRLQTELFLSSTLLCLKNGITFPRWYMERLEKMTEFVMYYTKPDGTAPQIGDNDDGRLHILASYGGWDKRDHRYLPSIGAALFNRADFKWMAGQFHEEAFWLLGAQQLEGVNQYPKSNAFPDGGFYIMRKNRLYMVTDCQPNDILAPSGHRHNSRLSFELFAYDKSFIIDPGAYIYTASKDMRNLFRSTKYHNTVVVDNEEQNRFREDVMFYMNYDAAVRVNRWETTDEFDFLDAEHYGYQRLKQPVVHRRQIWFDKVNSFWIIKDVLSSEGVHQFDLYFHFAPMELQFGQDYSLSLKTKTDGANIALIPVEKEGLSVEVTNGWISYSYGVKERAPVVKYSKSFASTTFLTIIYPHQGELSLDRVMANLHESNLLREVKATLT